MDLPATLLEAVRYFSDIDRCEAFLRKLRWPTGTIRCPECNSTNIGEVKTRRLLQCRDCRRQIYTKRGTILEDSPLGLDKWFVAVWCIANCKNGISSHELARALGIQQKSAWFMLHRIRTAMEIDGGDKFHSLLKRVVAVPKDKVDARMAEKKSVERLRIIAPVHPNR